MSKKFTRTILFLSFFLSIGNSHAFDNLEYLIKSMQWKKIHRTIKLNKISGEKEAFALIRFHESSGEGSRKTKLKLLYGVVTGLHPEEVDHTEITYLLNHKTMPQTTIFRLSFWKLYHELRRKNRLNQQQKLQYLNKLEYKRDPIVIKVFNEILKIHFNQKRYDKIISRIESLKGKPEANFLYSNQAMRMYGYSLLKESRISAGKQIYINLLLNESANYSLKRKMRDDLSKIMGDKFYQTLTLEELGAIINILPRDIQHRYIKENTFINHTFSNHRIIKNILYTYLYRDTDRLIPFLKRHQNMIPEQMEFMFFMVRNLIERDRDRLAKKILDTFMKNMEIDRVHKNYIRIYIKKNPKSESTFSATLKYLHLFPYNLYYQDALIDFLTDSSGSRVRYQKHSYWKKAMQAIPNLPVKGRLVYWYLRYLKSTGKTTELQKHLATFYKLCPGSYYQEVIKSEFHQELASIALPANPLQNSSSLIRYLSKKKLETYARELNQKDLSSSHYPGARQLADKLINAYQSIEGKSYLQTGVDYLKIGELRYGMAILRNYAREKKMTPAEKYLLFVGAGDISGQTYLSLYYTRQLMKTYLIPDDPLLLPEAITARLYPRPHRSLVQKNIKRFSVDENVVYAVMRQESFFRENAISPAKARGLMQVIPSTGRLLARALKIRNYSLHDPEISIQFGTKFIADLLRSYRKDLRWATIAYNGGPGNLRKWKRNHYRGDFNQFLENLPSRESRNYCRIVISNYINYRTLMLVHEIR